MTAENKEFGLPHPIASPAPKFSDSPIANFADSNPYLCTSSPDPTPSERTQIFMVSPPDSQDSVEQQANENVVFLTPPEHQSRLSFSSDDQNLLLDEVCCSNGVKLVSADGLKKARVSDGTLEEETELKKIRVGEIGGNTEHANGIKVTKLDGEDTVEDVSGGNGIDSILMKDCVPKGNAIDEENSFLCGISEIGMIGDENGTNETRQGNCVDGVEGVAKAFEDEEIGNRIQEVDVSTFYSKKSVGEPSSIAGNVPEWAVENEKNKRNMEQKGGLMDIFDVLRILVKNLDNAADDDDDEDILEIAKRRGIKFPKPRWWSHEDGAGNN